MFDIYYKKNDNSKLFKLFEENNLVNIQNYIPIYKRFFELNDTNYKNINLNQPYNIVDINPTDNPNKFECTIQSDKQKIKTTTFFKYSPLIDPIKFMAGKLKDVENEHIITLPKLSNNNCDPKVLEPNNSAYVDSFFTYLTSNILHKHRFIHGLDFYGSFLAIHKKYTFDVIDDIEYLNESKYFRENKNVLFDINIDENLLFNDTFTRNYRKKLNIDKVVTLEIPELLTDDLFNGVFNIPDIDCSDNIVLKYSTNIKSNCSTPSSKCSSRSSHSSLDDEHSDDCNSETDEESSSTSDYSLNSDVECTATIPNFPVQIICLESMSNTLDSLLYEDIPISEWISCLFQVIMMLVTYQKMFDLTHNDLHTNNIMFNKTDTKYLIYKYNNKYYKVPTYGRLFKIIDFGRAIYKYKGKTICSDSFKENGDAATQYNTEPFYNKNKPLIEPNKSFDLCRLGCSLYDCFEDIWGDKFETHPLPKLIKTWCTDDKGRNILYKKCGEERYPEFKLYKMIARTVHNHEPTTYVEHELFSDFKTSKNKIGKRRPINIDEMPIYT
jgi:hypothetical protein